MRFKLIGCQVFGRETAAVIERSPNQIDVEFLPKSLHSIGCTGMRERLQAAIDRVPAGYNAILLGYGLCNNGLAGLRARAVPFVVPRAHDCITVLLGNKERYLGYFERNPGTYFKSTGWMEHEKNPEDLDQLSIVRRNSMNASLEELTARFGEENARYLWEHLVDHARHYGRLTFIEMGVEPDDRFERQTREEAARRGWNFEKIQGDLSLLQRFVDGKWCEAEFLIVLSGQQLAPSYDGSIIAAEKA